MSLLMILITTAPISIVSTDGSSGTTLLAESSPEQVVYTPNPDFNGSDSFSYTITKVTKPHLQMFH